MIIRLISENKIFEENTAKLKENINGLEKKFTEVTVKHQRTLNSIEKGEFNIEEFERLKSNCNALAIKCQAFDRENVSLRRSANKWKRKFTNLR